jgi:hypothetical protein
VLLFLAWEVLSLLGLLAALNRLLHPDDFVTRWKFVVWGDPLARSVSGNHPPGPRFVRNRSLIELLMWSSFFVGGVIVAATSWL